MSDHAAHYLLDKKYNPVIAGGLADLQLNRKQRQL